MAAWLFDGIELSGDVLDVLLVALVFGLLNAVLKPILLFFSIPLLIVTLGFFALVVNAVEPEQIFRVNKVTMNPDTSVVFEVEGELDTEILVYASSDMKTWSLIARQPNSVGRISVFDAGAASKTRRFYKLVSENAPL